MKIGIVNDMRLACEALRRVISSTPGHDVVWTATDGDEAVRLAVKDRPDLILMDLIMPRVDGAEATRRIMSEAPCAILVVTSSVSGNMSKVYEAMSNGAQDAVDTPVLGPNGKLEGASALLQKIGVFEKLLNKPAIPRLAPARAEASTARPPSGTLPANPARPPSGSFATIAAPRETAGSRLPLVVIGVSTGGPATLATTLHTLPKSFAGCVVIVQHIDANFAAGLVTDLESKIHLPIQLASHGQEPTAGRAYLARTGEHLIMTPTRRLAYTREPRELAFRPSIDVFFNSVARNWPGPGIAIILTGMERDGAEGLLSLRRAGWYTIAQDPATCVVQSMPKAAIELGAVCKVLPPREIGGAILARAHARKGPGTS